jgi:hypothetical protein
MKDTPIFFTGSGSFTIQEFFNDLENINNNFLNAKQENKMKVELIQKTTLTDMYYVIKVNGEFHMSYNEFADAKSAYDRIKSATPREEIIESKEI